MTDADAVRPAAAGRVGRAGRARPGSGVRFDRLDALRGAAMLWMAAFHFGFDLAHARLWPQNFYTDPFWTRQRLVIVGLFLLCAGAGQAVAQARGQSWDRFWQRWAQVVACALTVSLVTAVMFPRSWISFGVLHGMAAMLLATRLLAGLGNGPLLALALAALLLPAFVADPFFDSRWTNWIGLVTVKPVTEDYVPVLPWLGVMLGGLVAGRWLLAHRPGWIGGPVPAVLVPLAALGRWPLTFYMLHQPVLVGIVEAVTLGIRGQ